MVDSFGARSLIILISANYANSQQITCVDRLYFATVADLGSQFTRKVIDICVRNNQVSGVSRWPIMSQPGRGQVETYRRYTVEHAKIHEYGSAARGETSTHRSRRRMIESAKDSRHYHQGKMCCRRTPFETILESKQI